MIVAAGMIPSSMSPEADPPAVAALVVTSTGRYLLQLRDDVPGIWFPNYWSLFGGLIENGETPEEAIVRELWEELSFRPRALRYFTQVGFDFRPWGQGLKLRYVFEVSVEPDEVATMVLGEGQGMALHDGKTVMGLPKLAPYDALAIGLHLAVAGQERPAVFPYGSSP